VRAIHSSEEEVSLLARFLRSATREVRFSLGSCAILCPTRDSARALALHLKSVSIEAAFMEGRDLDLASRGVKILTLNSAKGLEFPIVALAGFDGSHYTAFTWTDEKEEELTRLRRTIY